MSGEGKGPADLPPLPPLHGTAAVAGATGTSGLETKEGLLLGAGAGAGAGATAGGAGAHAHPHPHHHVVDLNAPFVDYGHSPYGPSMGSFSSDHSSLLAPFGEDQLLYRSVHAEEAVSSSHDDPWGAFNMGSMHGSLPSLSGTDDAVLKHTGHGGGGGGAPSGGSHHSALDPKFGMDHGSYESPLVAVVASSSAAPAVAAPPLPPGGYLEPGYHFFSTAPPRDIIEAVVAVLQAAEIDCVVKHEKFRVSATHYSAGSSKLPFSVRVFATEGYAHRYAVEFQRRTGSVMVFNEIFRAARRALESISGLVEMSSSSRRPAAATPPTPTPESLPPLPLTALPAGASAAEVAAATAAATAESEKNTRSTLKSLVAMAGSKFTDVKSQALSAICELSHNCTAAQTTMMLNEQVVKTCSEEMKSGVEDVHRCAVTAVANLTYRREDVGNAVMAADGLTSLITLSSSKTPQVVRECARALVSLATAVGPRMDGPEFRTALRTLVCSDDPRARTHSQELRRTLRITAV